MKENCKNCKYFQQRTNSEKKKLINRLSKIDGQVAGIKKMINDDRKCDEILIQISAVNKSLKSLGNEILNNHLRICVVNDIKNDNLDVLDDLSDLFKRIN